MRRIIVDYKKLTEEILNLLIEKYPDGYNDSDIITFKNASGEIVEAVEVRTEDTIYLVKVSVKLEQRMESFVDEDEDEDDGIPEEKEISFEKGKRGDDMDIDDDIDEEEDDDDMDDFDDDDTDDDMGGDDFDEDEEEDYDK
jgi:hypothetical protein